LLPLVGSVGVGKVSHGRYGRLYRNRAPGHKFLLYSRCGKSCHKGYSTRVSAMSAQAIPSLRQLRAFEAVARLESISAAARDIHLSQPGVSQAIHTLEKSLGAPLFERRRSGCCTSEPGMILLPRVRRFFENLRAALTDFCGNAPAGRQSIDAVVHRITRPQLQSLIAVSENPSFDAAARSLGISQPTLHRAARELERELRRSLYRRTATGVTVTPPGSELARRVQVALGEIGYGLDEIEAARGNIVSQITIGNIPHSATQILSTAIRKFLSGYPTLRIRIVDGHYEDLLNKLRAGKLDFLYGVLRRPDWAIDVKEEQLFSNPCCRRAQSPSVASAKTPEHSRLHRFRLDHARSADTASAGSAPYDGERGHRAKDQHRNNVTPYLPHDVDGDRPVDLDVETGGATERRTILDAIAFPVSAFAALRRHRHPHRVAANEDPFAIPRAPEGRSAPCGGRSAVQVGATSADRRGF
jgi:DNA-binding transcriptional LysR family regulator